MATRPQSYSDEIVRALNMIDVAFHDNDSVRRIWGEYIDMLNKPICDEQLNEKRAELLQEMAKGVKLGKEISHLDLKKCYMPVGLVEERQRSKEIGVELLHVLKESHGIKLIQKEQSEKEGTQ